MYTCMGRLAFTLFFEKYKFFALKTPVFSVER